MALADDEIEALTDDENEVLADDRNEASKDDENESLIDDEIESLSSGMFVRSENMFLFADLIALEGCMMSILNIYSK